MIVASMATMEVAAMTDATMNGRMEGRVADMCAFDMGKSGESGEATCEA
jgi:hypothetical protein